MKLQRTDKLIDKLNIDEDFVRMAMSIGGNHKSPLDARYYPFSDFRVTERYEGRIGGGSVYPWSDEYAERGYVKTLSSINIQLEGFDTEITIFNENAKLQGYYVNDKEGDLIQYKQYAPDPIKWINLLMEYGFVQIVNEQLTTTS